MTPRFSLRSAALLAVGLTIAGCQTIPPVSTTTVRIGSVAHNTFQGSFSRENRDFGLYGAVALRKIDNKLGVCAASTRLGGLSNTVANDILRDYAVSVNGKQVHRGLHIFPRVASRGEVLRSQAQCRVTEIPWNNSYSRTRPQISLKGSGNYRL